MHALSVSKCSFPVLEGQAQIVSARGNFKTGFIAGDAARFAAPGIDLIAEGDISAGAVAARTAEAATGAMSRFLNEEHGLKRIFDKGSEDLLQLAQMPDEQLEATWPGCR
jgi:hypothetical protein